MPMHFVFVCVLGLCAAFLFVVCAGRRLLLLFFGGVCVLVAALDCHRQFWLVSFCPRRDWHQLFFFPGGFLSREDE